MLLFFFLHIFNISLMNSSFLSHCFNMLHGHLLAFCYGKKSASEYLLFYRWLICLILCHYHMLLITTVSKLKLISARECPPLCLCILMCLCISLFIKNLFQFFKSAFMNDTDLQLLSFLVLFSSEDSHNALGN